MNNYPDDIRNYDDDPHSPFYIEPPVCEECEAELNCDVGSDGDSVWPKYSRSNCDCPTNEEDE